MNIFDLIVVNPLTNFLLALYVFFGSNLGWAIIFFTIALRLALLPLTIKQIQQQKKMSDLQPKLQSIQGKDPATLSPEEMALMKQTAGSCLGGCLPLLIQLPILIGLNFVIGNISAFNTDQVKADHILKEVIYWDWLRNALGTTLNTSFFGFDLASIPSKIPHDIATFWPYALLIILLFATQFWQSKIMTAGQNRAMEKAKKSAPNKKKLTKEEKEKQEMQEAMTKWTQMQTVYVIPFMVAFGAYSFSAGLGLYWFVQNLLAIGQTTIQYRHSDGRLNWEDTKKDFVEWLKKVSFGRIAIDLNTKPESASITANTEKSAKKADKKAKKSKKKKNKL